MKKTYRKSILKEKGITLIALVVTIVILLILAGITINTVLGENGIMARAIAASNEYKIASLKESISLYNHNADIIGKKVVPQEVFNKMKEDKLVDENAKIEGTWISTFGTKVSAVEPYKNVVILTEAEATQQGWQYGLTTTDRWNTVRTKIIGYTGIKSEEIIVPDYIGDNLVEGISGSVIIDNDKIEKVILPESMTIIEGYTFFNDPSIQEIKLPYLIETIGEGAFGKCTGIKRLEIPSSVKTIGSNAFVNLQNCEELVINYGVQTIGEYAFSNMVNVKKELIIPKSVNSIGLEGFRYFGYYNNTQLKLPNKTISIGENCFTNVNVVKYEPNPLSEEEIEKFVNNVNNIYDSNEKTVYLTFDDGPSYDNMTSNILDILKENNVKATFFMIGSFAKQYPEKVLRAYQEGHYIANHAYLTDDSQTYLSAENVLNGYNETEKVIREIIDDKSYSSVLFRFPGGSTGNYADIKSEAKNLFNSNKIACLDWNADIGDVLKKEDGSRYTVDEMYERMVNTSKDKNVVVLLMHNFATSTNSDEVLKRSIEYFKNNNYTFKNMYDLF